MTALALDTSVAVPYLVETHPAHRTVRARLCGVAPILTSHSLAETYSVLTRLPGDARLLPADAARLIAHVFRGETALLSAERAVRLPAILAPLTVVGGAVYDALVALAAIDADALLLTRDQRAAGTYAALSARVEILPDAAAPGTPV